MATQIGFSIIIFFSAFVYASGYIPQTYYVTERCGQPLTFSHDVRLKLSRYSSHYLPTLLKCHVTISSTSPSDSIMIKFRDLNTDSSYRCAENKLTLYDSNGAIMTGSYGVCGFITPSTTYVSTGNTISLTFTTNTFHQTGQFDILVTSFRYPNNNGSCRYGDFECDNRKCIWDGLTCDGYNNCGDRSDEITGCGVTHVVVIGASVGGVIFFFIVVLFIVFGARRRYYRSHCEDTCHANTYGRF